MVFFPSSPFSNFLFNLRLATSNPPLAGQTNSGPGTSGDAGPGASHGSTQQLELPYFQSGGEDSRRDGLHPQSGGPPPEEMRFLTDLFFKRFVKTQRSPDVSGFLQAL